MKASKLIKQLQKAIDKYGDINVGAYDHSYAFDVENEIDTHSIRFRVINGDSGELPGELPGESMDEEEEQKPSSGVFFGVIFYED